ncbi:MAG: hypothetical protein LBG14_04825 [Treponema sp.]|nr:hypothetical protein [Treponema sp.]
MEENQTVTLPPEYQGLTFEKVWAALQETDRMLKEQTRKMDLKLEETDWILQENALQLKEADRIIKETDRIIQENALQMKETDRQMKETDRKIGQLGNRFGELAEHLVAPSIREKFNLLGYTFDKVGQNIDISDALDRYKGAEIDLLLENGDRGVAVEVKARPQHKDVDRHVERMEVLRRWADRHDDKRKFCGAIAGAIFPDEAKNHALNAGFYVIEQTGDTVRIAVPEDFKPREW